MKPLLETIIFVGTLIVVTFLGLIYHEVSKTRETITAFTNQFEYEINQIEE